MKDYDLDKRQYVIAGVAIVIVAIYIVRLFALQIMSDDYKKNADSNAFLKKVEFPSRGIISDRNGKLLVYNQPSYDIMVIVSEQKSRLDTVEFCNALNITKDFFIKRMKEIQNTPGYSSFTQQLFMTQLSDQEFSVFQEKAYKFPGFYIQRRSIRQYEYPSGALLLGDVAEVSPDDIKEDDYYQPGDRRVCRCSCAMHGGAYRGVTATGSSIPNRCRERHLLWGWISNCSSWAKGSWRENWGPSLPSNRLLARCSVWYRRLPTTRG